MKAIFEKRDLTTGNEGKAMVLFALPFIMGNLFQQLYNIVDTIVVGQYIGADALAAVGASFSFMNFLTSVMIGLCMGTSVLFSQLFGAKDITALKKSIFASFVFIAGFTMILNIAALTQLDAILEFLNTPDKIFIQTKNYLLPILWGMMFTFLYNYFASVLRSIGNSFMPFVFLAAACLVNIILDVAFVVKFKMGVEGAAYATVTAQAAAGILTAGYCFVKVPYLRYKKEELRMEKKLLLKIVNYSMLTSLQQSVMNFGILMIQGLVNSFGVTVMAAFAAVVKIDAFAYMPSQEFGNSFSIYIAQNAGAGKKERIRQGTKKAFAGITVFGLVSSAIVIFFSNPLLHIFIKASETEMIACGQQYLWIEGSFYFLIGYLFLFYGYFRGIGQMKMSVVLTCISLGLRVALAYAFAGRFGVTMIWWAIPIGWLAADIAGAAGVIHKSRKIIPNEDISW